MKPHRHPVPAPTLRDDAEHGDTWRDRAACKDCDDPEIFYPGRNETGNYAIETFCAGCPVQTECLADAMKVEGGISPDGRHGIRGGVSAQARWNLYRRGLTARLCACGQPALGKRQSCETCRAEAKRQRQLRENARLKEFNRTKRAAKRAAEEAS